MLAVPSIRFSSRAWRPAGALACLAGIQAGIRFACRPMRPELPGAVIPVVDLLGQSVRRVPPKATSQSVRTAHMRKHSGVLPQQRSVSVHFGQLKRREFIALLGGAAVA